MCALNARSFATDRDPKRALVDEYPGARYTALAIALSTRAHDQILSKIVEISSRYRSVTVLTEIARAIDYDACRSDRGGRLQPFAS